MKDDSCQGGSHQQRLQNVLAAYYEAAERGDRVDRQVFINRNAELAAELADFFAVQDDVHQMAAPLCAVIPGGLNGNDCSRGNHVALISEVFGLVQPAISREFELGRL